MRMYDLTPLWRSSIGFDRVFDLLNNNASRTEGQEDFPPYNVTRTGEETYRISLALAGFAPEEISIVFQQNLLRVTGQKKDKSDGELLYQGIAGRAFERQFSLEDHIEVEGASWENGLLHIDLVRKLPEAMKPRRIEIGVGKPAKQAKGKPGVDHIRAAS